MFNKTTAQQTTAQATATTATATGRTTPTATEVAGAVGVVALTAGAVGFGYEAGKGTARFLGKTINAGFEKAYDWWFAPKAVPAPAPAPAPATTNAK